MSKKLKNIKPLPNDPMGNVQVFKIESPEDAVNFINSIKDIIKDTPAQNTPVQQPKANPVTGPMPNSANSLEEDFPSTISPIEFFDSVDDPEPLYTPIIVHGKIHNTITHTDAIASTFPAKTSRYIDNDLYLNVNRSAYSAEPNMAIADNMVQAIMANIRTVFGNKISFIIQNALYSCLNLFATDYVDMMITLTKTPAEDIPSRFRVDVTKQIFDYMKFGFMTDEGKSDATASGTNAYRMNIGNIYTNIHPFIDSLVALVECNPSVTDRDITTQIAYEMADIITMTIESYLYNRLDLMYVDHTVGYATLEFIKDLDLAPYNMTGMGKEMLSAIHLPVMNGILKYGFPQLVVLATDIIRPYIESIDKQFITRNSDRRYARNY